MKRFKKVTIYIVVVLLLVIAGLWIFSRTLHPTYKGNLQIANLSQEVKVFFDENGVPHINAKSEKDAMIALGYVHAQDRLWQMELVRRIAAGRLSEIFGKNLIRTDKLFSSLGIEEAAQKTINNLDKNSQAYQLTMAYLDGVNQFIESGPKPIEFYLLRIKKEKYTIKDVYNVFGYMAFSFAIAHKTDPLLTEIKEKLGDHYLEDITSSFGSNLTINKSNQKQVEAIYATAIQEITTKLPLAAFMGSNSWVIAPPKTKYGKVIFANDPHIGFSQPSVWYQNHIKTPKHEIYGFNLALMPFPLLGHNKKYAYGLTMLANDDLNFYRETQNETNENQYKTVNGWRNYEFRTKAIKVKGEKDSVYELKTSKHGPIINNIIEHVKDEQPIALHWIYTQLPNELLEVCYGMSHAKSIVSFKNNAARIHAPGLNVMYGDTKGNVAWFASAKLYQLRDSLSSKLYLDGASGRDEIVEYLDFYENPKAINPSWNYVYSANNQMDSVRGKLYEGYYQPEDRAKRIVTLLGAKDDFTKDDIAKMIVDVTSSVTPDILKKLLSYVDEATLSASEKMVFEILQSWDGNYLKESVAPTIYNRFLYEFLAATFKDELGKSFQLFINTQLQDQVLANITQKETSVWFDNIKTKNKVETKEVIVNQSFKKAIAFLQNQLGANVEGWQWKRVLSIEHEHAIGKSGVILRKLFNVGPFETHGGNEVINNHIHNIDSTGVYKVTAGPSSRRVIDFSDIENSYAVIPTGQSGNLFSKFYKNQAETYLQGKFVKMKLNQKEIENTLNILVLKPK